MLAIVFWAIFHRLTKYRRPINEIPPIRLSFLFCIEYIKIQLAWRTGRSIGARFNIGLKSLLPEPTPVPRSFGAIQA